MPDQRRWTALAVLIFCLAAAPGRADIATGVEAWETGDYPKAVSQWRPLADRGNAIAQFNMGQAYRFGRGIPADPAIARSWYEKAAQQGHQQAQAALGLLLYESGERRTAIYWIRKAAERGEPRAQYVLGIAHFNGDGVARDWPRAHALMSQAAAAVPQASTAMDQIDQHMLLSTRAGGVGSAAPVTPARLPLLSLEPAAEAEPLVLSEPAPAPAPAATAPKPALEARPKQAAAATMVAARKPPPSGRWRVQLGAYGNEAEARSRWQAITGRINALDGLTPSYEPFGRYTRLRAGPVGGKQDASRLCASAKASGQDCFVVAP